MLDAGADINATVTVRGSAADSCNFPHYRTRVPSPLVCVLRSLAEALKLEQQGASVHLLWWAHHPSLLHTGWPDSPPPVQCSRQRRLREGSRERRRMVRSERRGAAPPAQPEDFSSLLAHLVVPPTSSARVSFSLDSTADNRMRVPHACFLQEGCTPLHHAAKKNQAACVEILLDLGADIEGKDYVSGAQKEGALPSQWVPMRAPRPRAVLTVSRPAFCCYTSDPIPPLSALSRLPGRRYGASPGGI